VFFHSDILKKQFILVHRFFLVISNFKFEISNHRLSGQILSLTPFEKALILEEPTEFTDIRAHADAHNQLKLFDY